jgi:hypothetical protein
VICQPAGNQHEEGYPAFVEGIYRKGSRFFGNLRLHYFSTDSYNSRIYAYESDLLYHYYIPAFYDRGLRYYIRKNWDAGKRVSFWLRWAQIIYKDLEVIGSSPDHIEGSQRSEVRLQMRLIL